MADYDIKDIGFNVTIHFQNGVTIQRSVELPKAYTLSTKPTAIIPEDTDYIEVKGLNTTLIVPLNIIFVVPKSPDFKHVDSVSRYMLYKRDGGRCAYCGKEIGVRQATLDHIVPRSRGGKTTWNNVALSCKGCNTFKDDRTPEEAGMKLKITPHNPKKAKSPLTK